MITLLHAATFSMRCSAAFILLAGYLSTIQVSGLNLQKLKTSSVLNPKKYDDLKEGKCKHIKCPSTEELVCVKLRTSNGYSQKNIYVVVINRCELEYMKCHEELEAMVVPMKYCLHKKSPSYSRKVGSNKRVKRSPDIAAKASQDNNLASNDFRKSFADSKSPKINYNQLYYGPRQSRKGAEKVEESALEDISADPNAADDQDERKEEMKDGFLLTIDSTNADQYLHLTKDNHDDIDVNNESSNDEDANGKQPQNSRQIAEGTEDQTKESFNGEDKKEDDDDDADNEMPVKEDTVHSLSENEKLSKGSKGSQLISVVINYGKPDDDLDLDDKRLMDREKSGEISVEHKDQETSHVASEEVLKKQSEEQRSQETSPVASEEVLKKQSEEQRSQETSPVASEEASEQPIVEQKEEESSTVAPENAIEEPIVEQKNADSSPVSSEKVLEDANEKQKEEETSPVASEEVLEEHSGELKPDEVVTPEGPPDSNIKEENPNQNSKNREFAAKDTESSEESNDMINFETANKAPDYEEVDMDEYKSDCPTVCPSRDVMVCARCKEGVYRTFMSVCHLRMFNCKHPEEKLELVSRKPCMLSAPFLNDMPKAKGRVSEPGDKDPVLQYLRCKGRDVSDDPRCKFAAANDEAEAE